MHDICIVNIFAIVGLNLVYNVRVCDRRYLVSIVASSTGIKKILHYV